MPQPNNRQARIEARLRAVFRPVQLTVRDDSERHAGHAGAAEGGETHYSVDITSEAFAGQSRLERQRAIMKELEAEFAGGLHALALKARAPGD